jgi:hypothetical protein
MTASAQHDDLLSIINLLAGAAQAGAKGIVAQAALNVVLASEAVVRSRKKELDQSIQDAAMSVLNDAQNTLFEASRIEGAMEEAKQDIISNQQNVYNPNLKR